MSSNRGSILLEGSLLLILTTVAVVLQIELCRRVWAGIVSHVAAFESVRSSVLGFSETSTERENSDLFRKTLPYVFEGSISAPLKSEIRISSVRGKITMRQHLRYPALIPLETNGKRKRNYEVTQACSFPFLY